MNSYQVYIAAFSVSANEKLAEIVIASFDDYIKAEQFMENADSQFLPNVKAAFDFCKVQFPMCLIFMRRRLTESR